MKTKNSTLAPKAKTGNPLLRIVCFFAILATLISLTTISALAANGVWDGSGNTSGGDGGATVVDGDYNLEYADSRDIYGYRFTVFDANGTKLGSSVDVMFKADHNPTYRTQNKRSHTELYQQYLDKGTVTLGSFYSRVTFTSSYNGTSMSLYYDASLPSTPTEVETWLKANNGTKAGEVAALCGASAFGFESTYIVCEPLITATLDPMDGGSAAVYCMTIAEYAVYQSVAVGSWTSVPAYSTTGNYTVIMRHLSAFFPKYLYAEMEYSGVFATKPIDPDTHIWTPTSAGLYESHLLVGSSVWANTSADILKYQMGMAIYKDVVTVPYKITLNHQGGTSSLGQFYESYGQKFFLTPESPTLISNIGTLPTRAGYTFAGYYTAPKGSGIQVVDATGKIKVTNTFFTADQTIYAHWTENFLKVVYHSNGAEEILWQGTATTETYLNDSLYNSYLYSYTYTGGLRNMNSSTHLYLKKTGYTPTGYWIVDSPSGTIRIHQDDTSCPTGKTLAEKMGYSLANGSKTVHVYAEWAPITTKVTFHRNTSDSDTVTTSQTFSYACTAF